MNGSYRLGIVTSHPIQYQVPLFRALSARPEIDLTVFFCSDTGLSRYFDAGFGESFAWDVPLLEGYRHVFLQKRRIGRSNGDMRRTLHPGIVPVLLRHRLDAMLIHGWALPTNWLAFAAARLSGTPVLLRGESTGLSEPHGLKGSFKRVILTQFFKHIHAFLAIGSLNRSFYNAHGARPERIFSAPYVVDNSYFQQWAQRLASMKSELRKAAGIRPGDTVFLFCGKLTHVKRPLDLLCAFSRLAHRDRCFLIYAGDGTLRPIIEEHARRLGVQNVLITGFQNQTELPQWYAVSDVLVLPSDFEPWGLVVNEAMNFGLPVVATDLVGAAPDLVIQGHTGHVYPAGNVEQLAAILDGLAADRPRLQLMSESARNHIDGWNLQKTVGGYLEALQSVAVSH